MRPREEAPIPVAARYRDNGPRLREPAAHLVNPPHRLALGREQQAGAVVDDDLDSAVVMLDAQLVVLDRVARVRIAVGAAEVEDVVIEEREHPYRPED